MKLESKFTLTCHCGKIKVFTEELDALHYGVRHIRRYHKRLYRCIDKEARELAKSQEGLGYIDSDWPKRNTEPTFREAWRVDALLRMLQGGRAR